MLLTSFSYKTAGWELKKFEALASTCLLVGKNASGKTRTLRALQNVTRFLQNRQGTLFQENEFKTKLTFAKPSDPTWKMAYTFEVLDKKVVSEKLIVNGKVMIDRVSGRAIFKGAVINPPADKLVVHVRRDKDEYPEIESLMEWVEGVIAISCSNINAYTLFMPSDMINPESLSDLVKSLTNKQKKTVIDNMKQMGYDITSIGSVQFNAETTLVSVKERYVREPIHDFQLSSGMMRVLYLLCFLQSIQPGSRYSMLLVDDLGEGLDYHRVTMLGKMVYDRCEQTGVQLIASSNDAFLMDVVDISKWQILRREKSRLTVLNEKNEPRLFADFRMTGLSNFDFLSSDFIDNCFADRE